MPMIGSSNLSTIGQGPTTIEVRKIPTAIFFLLRPTAILGANKAINTTLAAFQAANVDI